MAEKTFIPEKLCSGSPWDRLLAKLYALCLDLHPATEGCRDCRYYMLSVDARACHAIEPDFDVDAVYTWVDGADSTHAAKRARWLSRQGAVHGSALEAARFRDNEELRYSLRALERFAPWVRRVILATDGQRPFWLRADHPKIRIVDHSEFIPHEYLPTFNSHVIEAYLHTITGLSEQYLYMNDDVFLARPCRKTDFFTSNGLPLAFVDWRIRRRFGYSYTKTPHAMSYFNTLRILEERGVPTNPGFVTAHGPYAQTRTNMAAACGFYRDAIKGFAGNRFRTTAEIAMYSHGLPLWIYGQKRLVPCDERYYYVQTRRRDRAAYYRAILKSREEHVPPLFFCINDVGGSGSGRQWKEDLRYLLESYFPRPSSFETDMAVNTDGKP
ncbi:MAG: Stealth CR1 domain-containing protein [Desulfovibrio sp.]|jgi:hypothetical protein|nr:Stealth CR1 domain-containing protein [Desulfovibrio sp.]